MNRLFCRQLKNNGLIKLKNVIKMVGENIQLNEKERRNVVSSTLATSWGR